MNPEQKKILIKNQLQFNRQLSPCQKEYFELMNTGDFSLKSLCEYYHKTGQIVSFREIWDLLVKLDKANLLIEPQLSDWQASNIDTKISSLAQAHVGYHEKARASELKTLPFFRNLKDEIVDLLADLSSVHKGITGTLLCQQDKNDRALFVILEGQASIYRNIPGTNQRMLIVRVEKGSVIGETAFFLGEKRTADVIMSTPGKIVKITYDERLDEIIKAETAQNLKERFWFLQALIKSPLFINLPEPTFDALLYSGKTMHLSEREVLFREGDNSDCFYIIIQGSILISQKGDKINVLGSGDSFGEITFLHINEKRTATVTAQTPSLLMRIPNIRLTQLIYNNLALALLLEKTGIERLQKDQKRQAS
jgi:CRP-like cAMP-binding protein